MLWNCGIGEDSRVPWTARSNQSILKEINTEYSRTYTEPEAPILWPPGAKNWLTGKDWQRLRAGERDDREWDGWMASPTWWTWVWASSGSWWWTGKSGMLQSMELQRVGHDWATQQQQGWPLGYWPSAFSWTVVPLIINAKEKTQ